MKIKEYTSCRFSKQKTSVIQNNLEDKKSNKNRWIIPLKETLTHPPEIRNHHLSSNIYSRIHAPIFSSVSFFLFFFSLLNWSPTMHDPLHALVHLLSAFHLCLQYQTIPTLHNAVLLFTRLLSVYLRFSFILKILILMSTASGDAGRWNPPKNSVLLAWCCPTLSFSFRTCSYASWSSTT